MSRSPQELEAIAARVRQAHYGGVDVAALAPTPVVEILPTKRGAPCETQNEGWLAARAKQALSIALVISSAKVPDDVRAARMASCVACDHCTIREEKHYCECCGCPAWSFGHVGSALEYKVGKAAWMCPRKYPAYGPWSPAEHESTVEGESPTGS